MARRTWLKIPAGIAFGALFQRIVLSVIVMLSITPVCAQVAPSLTAADVKKYQGWLQHLGVYRGPVDGVFSSQFEESVKAYQRSGRVDWPAFKKEADLLITIEASADLLKEMTSFRSAALVSSFSMPAAERDGFFKDLRAGSGFFAIDDSKIVGATSFFMRGAVQVPIRIDPGLGYGLFYNPSLDIGLAVMMERTFSSYKMKRALFVPGEMIRSQPVETVTPTWVYWENKGPLLSRLKSLTKDTILATKTFRDGSDPLSRMTGALTKEAQAFAEGRLLYMALGVNNQKNACGDALDDVSKNVREWSRTAKISNVTLSNDLSNVDLDLTPVAGLVDDSGTGLIRLYAVKVNPFVVFSMYAAEGQNVCHIEALNGMNLYSFYDPNQKRDNQK